MSKRIFALILALVMVMGSFSVFGTKADAAAVKSGSTEAEIPRSCTGIIILYTIMTS